MNTRQILHPELWARLADIFTYVGKNIPEIGDEINQDAVCLQSAREALTALKQFQLKFIALSQEQMNLTEK